MREKQAEMVINMTPAWTAHELGPPIVVHCSAGIGRTGTFCTLDIAIRKFEDTEKVDIKTTGRKQEYLVLVRSLLIFQLTV